MGVMIQFIMVNEIPKSRRKEKEVREPFAFKVSILNLTESFIFKDKKQSMLSNYFCVYHDPIHEYMPFKHHKTLISK